VLRSFEGEHIDLSTFNKIIELLAVKAPPTLMGRQAKHAVIAAGQADLLIRLPAARVSRHHLDQAAGSLIVEEAGGRVTDLLGIALDFTAGRRLARNEGVIASNGRIHTRSWMPFDKFRLARNRPHKTAEARHHFEQANLSGGNEAVDLI
jgi:3'(2'), 5'-bisphosphate nucleotidase